MSEYLDYNGLQRYNELLQRQISYIPTEAGTSGLILTSSGIGSPVWKTGESIHVSTSNSGTTGTKNTRSIWLGTADGVTSLYDGLIIEYKIPVAGAAGGVTLNINNLGEHPVVLNAATAHTTHYPVGAILILIYDSELLVAIKVNSVATTFTGCWKIHNYDANTTYSTGTAAILEAGTNTTARLWAANVLGPYLEGRYALKNGLYISLDTNAAPDSDGLYKSETVTIDNVAKNVISIPPYESGAQVNVLSDWNAASGSSAEILNKPTIPTETTVTSWGFTKNAGTVTGIKVGSSGSTINPSSGVITIPAYETGAEVHKAPTATEVKNALGTGSGTTKYLREDGTWVVPPNAVSSVAGRTGAVTLSSSDVGLGNVGNFKAVSTVASLGLTDIEKSDARANIGASSFSGSYGDLSNKPGTISHSALNAALDSTKQIDALFV